MALGYAAGFLEQRATMETALAMGLDFVGGALALTLDPRAEIDALFALAEKYGKTVDLHVDETEDPRMNTLAYVAEKTVAHGLQAGDGRALLFAGFFRRRHRGQDHGSGGGGSAQYHHLASCNLVSWRTIRPTPRG
ncbi:MAG: hypothetical protein R2932_53140 [Caldilineaceae bacterium]